MPDPIFTEPALPSPLQLLQQSTPGQFRVTYTSLRSIAQKSFDAVWNSSDYTPQQAFDVFGTKAGTLVAISLATRTYILAIEAANGLVSDPTFLVPPANPVVNADGTVTVTPF